VARTAAFKEGTMRKQTGAGRDLFSRRLTEIGMHPERLEPQQRAILEEIRAQCPNCESPGRCAADLAATEPKRILQEWDEYCPNAARLRILAALSMFGTTPHSD
jgi:hypothetical protein